jgi:alkaline phosphatase D
MASDPTPPKAIPRRTFLVLAASTVAWVSGCGDDSIGEAGTEGDASSGGGGTSGRSTSAGQTSVTSMGPDGTGATTDDPSGSTGGDTDSGGAESCEGVEEIEFDPDSITQDDTTFPLAVMAGEMRPESAMLAVYLENPAPKLLRVWQPSGHDGTVLLVHEQMVTPAEGGYVKVTVDGLCAGQWFKYAFFEDNFSARSAIGEFRTAIADDALEPLTLAVTSCNGDSFDWPALSRTSEEYYDMFLHLGDMAYNDGSVSLQEYRESWKDYLRVGDMKAAYARSGLYACWDDHEVDNNSSWDPRTMDPDELQRIQNAKDAFFEVLPIDNETTPNQLWRSFRWGLTAEIIVLDCRTERRPSQNLYISSIQMAWLKERLMQSPCHFKIIMNSVPITNMPNTWDLAASDRWEGFPAQRGELLSHIEDNNLQNIWFLSGDFHVCFVSTLEASPTTLSGRVREIAVTGGNVNPIPDFLLPFPGNQFAYGERAARALLITLDPENDAVHVRFIDAVNGNDSHNATYVYGQ